MCLSPMRSPALKPPGQATQALSLPSAWGRRPLRKGLFMKRSSSPAILHLLFLNSVISPCVYRTSTCPPSQSVTFSVLNFLCLSIQLGFYLLKQHKVIILPLNNGCKSVKVIVLLLRLETGTVVYIFHSHCASNACSSNQGLFRLLFQFYKHLLE